MPTHVLQALRESNIEEVVVVGRRGVAQSAFTVPEFAGLLETPGVDVTLHRDEIMLDTATAALAEADDLPHAVAQKLRLLRRVDGAAANDHKRIVLRYLLSPTRVLGDTQLTGVEFDRMALETDVDGTVRSAATGEKEIVEAGLVLTSIGYRGVALPGVPFDERRGVIPNRDGRVLDVPDGDVFRGTYVTGWIKRGPSGFIGTNKSCAQGTVLALVDDFNSGRLPDIEIGPKPLRPWRRRRA